MIALVLKPHIEARRGCQPCHFNKFDAYLGSRLVCTSARPLVDSARILLAEGFDPETIFQAHHEGSDTPIYAPWMTLRCLAAMDGRAKTAEAA